MVVVAVLVVVISVVVLMVVVSVVVAVVVSVVVAVVVSVVVLDVAELVVSVVVLDVAELVAVLVVAMVPSNTCTEPELLPSSLSARLAPTTTRAPSELTATDRPKRSDSAPSLATSLSSLSPVVPSNTCTLPWSSS
ncbi:unnamed protein product [Prorocentrum cordatum]|uniref:Uncharacterized protein n=1 Tax=Prorocentrum cordatum TaxID=2364126 RepID=A0ABN9QD34_9DINO|nr:unnamed protein product [Polarella glacialis]